MRSFHGFKKNTVKRTLFRVILEIGMNFDESKL